MKVFFTASQRGKKDFGKYYQKIFEEIKKQQGCIVIKDDLLTESQSEFYRKLDEGGRKANIELFKEKMLHLHESDVNIFDCSYHSLSTGYLIEKSLVLNKPTVVLYYKNNESYLLEGADNEKLIVRSYNEKNISKIIREVISLSKERRDKRFNFFISPKLLGYLEKVSKHEGTTKSTFIRSLILEHMRKSQIKNI